MSEMACEVKIPIKLFYHNSSSSKSTTGFFVSSLDITSICAPTYFHQPTAACTHTHTLIQLQQIYFHERKTFHFHYQENEKFFLSPFFKEWRDDEWRRKIKGYPLTHSNMQHPVLNFFSTHTNTFSFLTTTHS